MRTLKELSSMDVFFYYGQSDLEIEIESDILEGVLQPRRTEYYNRRAGAGVPERENAPSGLTLAISVRYDIVNWLAYRNTQVSDGTRGDSDRRVAATQQMINIETRKAGEADVSILYVPFANLKKYDILKVPLVRKI